MASSAVHAFCFLTHPRLAEPPRAARLLRGVSQTTPKGAHLFLVSYLVTLIIRTLRVDAFHLFKLVLQQ